MKLSLRTGILIAFGVFIILALGASQIAHVFSYKARLEKELQICRTDLEDVTANLERLIDQGKEAEGLAFFENFSAAESIGGWDCCYVLCDTAGQVITPQSLAGKPLEYSVYRERPDGITLGTFAGHKVAIIHSKVRWRPYMVYGLYDKDYILED
ncbi:MAG: hypothetical protein J5693_03640, partial [Bacteroidales bacterium]|nr:hypothetical protein [Bacteroidales bacterium]